MARRFAAGVIGVFILMTVAVVHCWAQTETARVSGQITDAAERSVPKADIRMVNLATGVASTTTTNDEGIYSFTGLIPGRYRVMVQKQGFREVIIDGLTLNVQDVVAQNVQLQIGSVSELVTVEANGLNINTTDASVSTIVDRKFVENIPLNGRSLQDLILLTPGVLTTSPQRPSGFQTGEFSVNGQRTESNYYTVDGVSANVGTSNVSSGAGISGSQSASTALGTTQSLVSIDALQEFRVQSSSYSAEYGRNPGGQFSFVTRSGTNDWHGTAFDYFRNDALDANDWFNNAAGLPKSAERQNDFGGTLGGPLEIPRVYNGKDRTFFFFSYEGLRLDQPAPATINYVPDVALRQSTSGPLQQALNAFPLPTPNAPDLGNGLGEFIANWSNPSQVDAISVRIDQNLGQRTHLFFRFSSTESNVVARQTNGSSPSEVGSSSNTSYTYTFGATTKIAQRVDNDFRLNYSSNALRNSIRLDNFGGAVPVDFSSLHGLSERAAFNFFLNFGAYSPLLSVNGGTAGKQRQWNLVDTVNIQNGKHAFKIGIDWRRLSPIIQQSNPLALYLYDSAADVTANSVYLGYGESQIPNLYPVYLNFSAFAQDEWRIGSRLNLSAGLRWDVNPAPGVSQGLTPYTVIGLNDYATMTLAPQGTSLWKTSWYNVAPRLGAAYLLNSDPQHQTVIRGGAGVFFDTGQQTGSFGFQGVGTTARTFFGSAFGLPTSFPVSPATAGPVISQPPTAPYALVFTNPPNLELPYTLQWNVSVEQALGRSQSLTLSYVGAGGRKLLELADVSASQYNPSFRSLYVYRNGLSSNYNAFQVKYQRQITHGLQVLAAYTFSHSLDYGSYNALFPYQYGNSDFDVRHNATAALSYDLPHGGFSSSWLHALSSNWGLDGRFSARSGFPITLDGNSVVDPNTGQLFNSGLNLVAGEPFYLYGPQFPGGRSINSAAFSLPTSSEPGDAPRNFLRGFGAWQIDMAVRREFPLYENLRLQFRAEAFNILNHPNFGTIDPNYGDIQFGQATASLARSLGTLSPLYQAGGPRSLQLALKLIF